MASTPADSIAKTEPESLTPPLADSRQFARQDAPQDEPKAESKAEPKAKGRKKASKAEPAKGLQVLAPLIHNDRVIEPGEPVPKSLTEDDLERLKRLGIVG